MSPRRNWDSPAPLSPASVPPPPEPKGGGGYTKEVIKEQPSSRNLSATAARVLQCTCPVAASRKNRSAIVKLYC